MLTEQKPGPRPGWSLPTLIVSAALTAGLCLYLHLLLSGLLAAGVGAAALALHLHLRSRRRWHAVLDDFARREIEREQQAPVPSPWSRLPRTGRSSPGHRVAPRGA